MTALKKADGGQDGGHNINDGDDRITSSRQSPIPFDTPGKVSAQSSGAPLSLTPSSSAPQSSSLNGNAFELVYHELSAKVRNTVYQVGTELDRRALAPRPDSLLVRSFAQADPVLENWIQNHLYGDVYSSPGLSMLSKQHLTIAGLVKSNMMDQLYGHALAGLRFGGDVEFLKGIVDIVVHWQKKVCAGASPEMVGRFERIGARSKRVIDMAVVKYGRMKEEAEEEEEGVVGEVVNPEGTMMVPDFM
jgi:hypothetical protein